MYQEVPPNQTPEWRLNMDSFGSHVIRCCPHPMVYENKQGKMVPVRCDCPCRDSSGGCEKAFVPLTAGTPAERTEMVRTKLAELNPNGATAMGRAETAA